MIGHVLLLTGSALTALSVLLDVARGCPADGAVRSTGRVVLAVAGPLTRPLRRRRWRDVPRVRVEVDEVGLTVALAPRRVPPPPPPPPPTVGSCTTCGDRVLCRRYGRPVRPSWAGDRR